MNYKHLFGPVASRRLGFSLGIDLVPFKTCSLDCIYCECGATTCLTTIREDFINTDDLKKEIDYFIKNDCKDNKYPDYFTFSGAGEPTLASNFGEIVAFIKGYNIPSKVALLTNSTLLFNVEVRKELSQLDLIVPSLDAVLEDSFKKINRPTIDLKLDKIIDGLISLRKEFYGQIYLEIFIIPGVNSSKKELEKFKKIILKINPDEIQLNSLDRPGALPGIVKAPRNLLESIKENWNLENVKIISTYPEIKEKLDISSKKLTNYILNTISRRPCTVQDIIQITGKEKNDVILSLDLLLEQKKIKLDLQERGAFYSVI